MSTGLFDLDIGPTRRSNDFYPTAPAYTRALVDRCAALFLDPAIRILEPCAGDHRMTRELCRAGSVLTNEPYAQPDCEYDYQLDATKPQSWLQMAVGGHPDLIITNPPFDLAEQIVPLALQFAARAVCMLLRITWFEPTEGRAGFLRRFPPTRLIVFPRKSFKGTGSDSATTAWFIWCKDATITPGMEVVTRAEFAAYERNYVPCAKLRGRTSSLEFMR